MHNVLGSQELWNLKTLIVDQKRLRIPDIHSHESSTPSETHSAMCVWLSVCMCETRAAPLCCLFNEYKFYQRPPRPEQNTTWSQSLTQNQEENEEEHKDLDASLLSLSASDNPTAISACLCPQRMLCPHPPTNQQATQPVTSQCSQISCDPIRACCRALLRLREKERQTEREWGRELSVGSEVKWRETDKEREIQRTSQHFKKRYLKDTKKV